MNRSKSRIFSLILLFIPLLLSLFSSVNAGFYQSTPIAYRNRVQGARLVVHDANPSVSIKYYAVLSSAITTSVLGLSAYTYVDNSLSLSQDLVTGGGWVGGASSGYCVSNIVDSTFYVVYQQSYNSITAKPVTFNYSASGVLFNFIVGSQISFTTASIIYDSGLCAIVTPDGKLWIGAILQTSILIGVVYQVQGNAMVKAATYDLDFNQIWGIQLGSITNTVYAWGYGQVNINSEQVVLWNADSGAYLWGYSSGYTGSSRNSVVNLANGSIAIIYHGADDVFRSYVFNGNPTAMYSKTIITLPSVLDVSAFTMPNNFFGFFYAGSAGVNAMYYSTDSTGARAWSGIQNVLANSGVYPYDHCYSDPYASVNSLITYPSHPTVWIGNSGSTYYSLVSVDLFSVNGLSVITTYQMYSITGFTSVTSVSTQYSSTTTTSVLNTVTASALSTPMFLSSIAYLLMFILAPAGLFGYMMGLLGFSLGAMAGASVAFVFNLIPLWFLLIIIVIQAVVLVLFRGNESNE